MQCCFLINFGNILMCMLGVPAEDPSRGDRSVFSVAGVHTHSAPHSSGGLRARLLRRAPYSCSQTPQWSRETPAFQLHHTRYDYNKHHDGTSHNVYIQSSSESIGTVRPVLLFFLLKTFGFWIKKKERDEYKMMD